MRLYCIKNQILVTTGQIYFTKGKIYDFNKLNNTMCDDDGYIWLHFDLANISDDFITMSQYRKLKLEKINETR